MRVGARAVGMSASPHHAVAARPMIDLESWEFDLINLVGARRCSARWGSANAAHYDERRMEDDRTAQVAACAAELAVAKFVNQYWHASVWDSRDHFAYANWPDVGKNIEVRRVRTSDYAAVRRRQLNHGLILFVAKPTMPECRAVEILGWQHYDYAWTKAAPSEFDENTRILDPKYLRFDEVPS